MIPGEALAQIERLTKPEDHLLIFALYRAAAEGKTSAAWAGMRVDLAAGEVMLAQEALASRARVTRQSVRTSLARLEAAGLVLLGRASLQSDDETLINRSQVRVRLVYYDGTVARLNEANHESFALTSPSSTPAPRRVSDVAKLMDAWARWWAELRGGAYAPVWGRDGAAARRLLARAGMEEIERRARRALVDPWFQRAGSLYLFDSHWNNYDGVVRANGSAPARREVVGIDGDGRPVYREEDHG